MIPLHHPATGRTTKARDAQVPALLDRGWEHVEPPGADESGQSERDYYPDPPESPERTHATDIADGIEADTPEIEEATARVREHTDI